MQYAEYLQYEHEGVVYDAYLIYDTEDVERVDECYYKVKGTIILFSDDGEIVYTGNVVLYAYTQEDDFDSYWENYDWELIGELKKEQEEG